jgi:photosystem II stability/assembly factor-like uncharacterized protein
MTATDSVSSTTAAHRGWRYGAPGLLILVSVLLATPATAQWTRVTGIPATRVFSLWANGDTIAAGTDTVVYVSTDAGTSWGRSTKPVSGLTSIEALWLRGGRLFAGIPDKGVYVSEDWGATWAPFNEGLVGGLFDSQLDVVDLAARGDNLFAATAGAGVYVRSFVEPSAWQLFGSALEPNQASNVSRLVGGGSRLIALAGSNGMVFFNEPGETDWTPSNLDNVGIRSGLAAQSGTWTGTQWVIGTNGGLYRSPAGQEPWVRFDARLGTLIWTAFVTQKGHIFAAFDTPNSAVLEESVDDGTTWDNEEVQPGVFIQALTISGNVLYAARSDGLWLRRLDLTGVAIDGTRNPLRFAMAGPQPFGNRTSLRFELSQAQVISIELFDVRGRLVRTPAEGRWTSGRHEVVLDGRGLASGVYIARLTAGARRQVVRLVHVR